MLRYLAACNMAWCAAAQPDPHPLPSTPPVFPRQLLLNMSCLWTFGRYLEASRLPRPALSMAAIFVLGGWLGSLASANLDAYYVTCGASAGVCALLGGCLRGCLRAWAGISARVGGWARSAGVDGWVACECHL